MTKLVPLKLEDGNLMYVEVERTQGEQNVSTLRDVFSMDQIKETISSFGQSIQSSLQKLNPDKSQVEFGFELTVKEGKLVAVLAQGECKASIKVTLEWKGK